MATAPGNPPKHSFSIIASRQQRREFDRAVRDVIKQRKFSTQIQTAVQQARRLEKQSQNGRGGPAAGEATERAKAKLQALVQSPQFALIQEQAGVSVANAGGGGGSGVDSPSLLLSQRRSCTGELRGQPGVGERRRHRGSLASYLNVGATTASGDWGLQRKQQRNSINTTRDLTPPPRVRSAGHGPSPRSGGAANHCNIFGMPHVAPSPKFEKFESRRSSDPLVGRRRLSMNRSASFKSTLNLEQIEDIIDDAVNDELPPPPPRSPVSQRGNAPQSPYSGVSEGLTRRVPSEGAGLASLPIEGLNVAALTIKSIRGGDQPGNNLNISDLGGDIVSGRILGDDDGDDSNMGGSGVGAEMIPSYNRKGSLGDSLLIPSYRFEGGKEAAIREDDREREGSRDKLMQRKTFQTLSTATVFETVRGGDSVLASDFATTGQKKIPYPAEVLNEGQRDNARTNNDDMAKTKFGIQDNFRDLSMLDLVSTQRKVISRTGSERNELTILKEFDEGMVAMEKGDKGGEVKGRVDQWEKDESWLEPSQLDFTSGEIELGRGVGTGHAEFLNFSKGRQEVGDVVSEYEAAVDFQAQSIGIKQASASSSLSYKTALSNEPSPSPSEVDDEQEVSHNDASCPRSQFVLFTTQAKSHSGATRKTHGTSSSSLFSSGNSVIDNPATGGSSSNQNNFDIIEEVKEEERDMAPSMGRRQAPYGDSIKVHNVDNVPPGFSKYKRRRSSRIKRIRRGIQKSLRGAKGNKRGTTGEGEHSNEAGSHAGSISADQQERLSRHLQHRQGSSRSMTSNFSSFSAITGTSDTSTRSGASGRWARFLPKARPKMQKASSMREPRGSDLGGNGSSRRILIAGIAGSISSNVSQISSRSNASHYAKANGMDDLSNGAHSRKFTDFYNNDDHARAVSRLLSTESTSGRSLATSLATVREPAHHEGEQKHDEDYHCMHDAAGARETLGGSHRSCNSATSFYHHPSHDHPLVHTLPNQLFPDSPGWQCDECCEETFNLDVRAYVSTEKNYLVCERCFAKNGFSVSG